MEMRSETLVDASGSGGVLNGIKSGEMIYFENVVNVVKCSPAAPAIPAPFAEKDRSSPKKGRGVTVSSHPPRCQVQGCNADLTGLKTYYCRHRVCGMHSKFPKVIVGGLEQRFCQQCSRFHLLAEFDQGKRSCRRRLAGHNERRRKPHSSSFVSHTFAHVASILKDDVSRTRGFWDYPYSEFPGRQTVWHKSVEVDQGIEEKFKPSLPMWQGSFNSSTKAASSNIQTPHFQRTLDWISLPASDGPASECFAVPVSASRGALSLLSTQTQLHSRKTLSFGLSANTDATSNSWSFRNPESEVSSDDLAVGELPSTSNSDCFQMSWSL